MNRLFLGLISITLYLPISAAAFANDEEAQKKVFDIQFKSAKTGVKSLQDLCGKVVAQELYNDPYGKTSTTMELLPHDMQRFPRMYFIDNLLKDGIGWHQKKLNIGMNFAQERYFTTCVSACHSRRQISFYRLSG